MSAEPGSGNDTPAPGTPIRPGSILLRDQAPGNFPFEAFSFDPESAAAPNLTLNSPWKHAGDGTGLTNAITGTAAALTSSNPTLLVGQLGFETDTGYVKIGDGSTAWTSLAYYRKRAFLIGSTVYEEGKWVAYTPTFTGFGTPTNVSFCWKREGGSLKVMGKFTAGTTTAVEARISLPLSLTSDATLVPSIMLCNGGMTTNVVTVVSWGVLIESGVGYLTFSAQNSGAAGLTKLNGSSILSAGQISSLTAEVPISGWN